MEYLHSTQPHPVIHGDLKTQNVLVGDNLIPKVCLRLSVLFTNGHISATGHQIHFVFGIGRVFGVGGSKGDTSRQIKSKTVAGGHLKKLNVHKQWVT